MCVVALAAIYLEGPDMTQILGQQQHALAHVTEKLHENLRDLVIMETGQSAAAALSAPSKSPSEIAVGVAQMLLRR